MTSVVWWLPPKTGFNSLSRFLVAWVKCVKTAVVILDELMVPHGFTFYQPIYQQLISSW